jgi:transposase
MRNKFPLTGGEGRERVQARSDQEQPLIGTEPQLPEGDKRFGYSRDHRRDCVQIVIAVVVTPEGLPLAHEVLPGNTADNTTLRGF